MRDYQRYKHMATTETIKQFRDTLNCLLFQAVAQHIVDQSVTPPTSYTINECVDRLLDTYTQEQVKLILHQILTNVTEDISALVEEVKFTAPEQLSQGEHLEWTEL